MAAPTRQQALEEQQRQAEFAADAAAAVTALIVAGAPWAQILTTIAAFQFMAAALASQTMAAWNGTDPVVRPTAFAGVSSMGYPIEEPIVAAIDYFEPAPEAVALPDVWWTRADEYANSIEQAILAQVQEAANAAAATELYADADAPQYYIRFVVPPCCKRCAVLAGRLYRDNEGFERHPNCKCIHVPVKGWDEAVEMGIAQTVQDLYESGAIRDLTEAEATFIGAGADPVQILNASITRRTGEPTIYTADLFGHTVKATRYGTTRRSRWRRNNPSLLVRLRPESILRLADGDAEEAFRLLELYGYLDAA